MAYLTLNNVTKSYGSKVVLDKIKLQIKEGSVVTIFGPSGVGKTTLLNIIMGLSTMDEGEIIFKETKLTIPFTESTRKAIAYIPDTPIFYDYLTGKENLKYFKEIYNSDISDEEIEVYLEQFNLLQHKDTLFKNYSKGMKQKLMLISTFISDASLIILDEPTVGLDLVSSYELQEIIVHFKKMRKTVLLATHDINFSQSVSDQIIIISNGGIVYEGENNLGVKLQDIVLEHIKGN